MLINIRIAKRSSIFLDVVFNKEERNVVGMRHEQLK